MSLRYDRGEQVFFISNGEICQGEITLINYHSCEQETFVYYDVIMTVGDNKVSARVKEEYLFYTVDELMKTTLERYNKKTLSK